jgi:protein transport protein SEC31
MVRLREIPRTAAFAWSTGVSPKLVTGTKAGAVSADFSDDTALELWDLDLSEPTAELQPTARVDVDSRFHAIAWSQPTKDRAQGLIAGALESGSLDLWDAEKLASSSYVRLEWMVMN